MPATDMTTEGQQTTNAPANRASRPGVQKPWMAKLPPELRKAIRNNAQQRPPRGYEERLQEYFQNLE